jgi:DNA mismatch repair protein MutL
MDCIKNIDYNIISKLSANEAIEDIYSIVKELVENSIDAQSSEVTVYLEDCGRKSIIVEDDGRGMSYNDLMLCLKQYTSSKVRSLEDVNFPSFYGFRGEALFSISSVSKISLFTRSISEQHGWEFSSASKMPKPKAFNKGTRIQVEDLFYNTPGRREFLKNKRIEIEIIKNLLIDYSILYNEIKFSLYSNNRKISLLQDSKFFEKIQYRLRIPEGSNKIEIDTSFNTLDGETSVSGYLFIHDKREYKTLFFNGRRIKPGNFNKIIKNAYSKVTNKKSFKFSFILFINFKQNNKGSQVINFNYHPRKEEIQISKNQNWDSQFESCLVEEIDKYNLIDLNAFNVIPSDFISDINEKYLGKVVGQVHNSWIISENENVMFIIDQHAAHERIIYEKMKSNLDSNLKTKVLKTKKITPILIDDSIGSSVAIENYGQFFKKIGFIFNETEEGVFLTDIPNFVIENFDWKTFFIEQFEQVLCNINPDKAYIYDRILDLANKACKKAIKINKSLSYDEMTNLIRDMEKTPNGYVCNHGRPTVKVLSNKDILKLFDRY